MTKWWVFPKMLDMEKIGLRYGFNRGKALAEDF